MTFIDSRVAFVVLGMHRSGTSAVAGALVRRGAQAGRALLPSTSDNANGYFEDARLVAASDALLGAAGLAWDEPGPLPRPLDALRTAEPLASLRAVFGELRDAPGPVMVKDPRACRLLPEWSQAMADAGLQPAYLIVLRDPREVTASLGARDGMGAFRAELLWLEHLLEAERATRGEARAFLDFGALVASPDDALDAALAALGPMGRTLDARHGTDVDPALRRQRAAPHPGVGFADDVFAFARTLVGGAGAASTVFEAFNGFYARWCEVVETARAALDDARHREAQARERDACRLREVGAGLALADAWSPRPPRSPVPRVYWRPTDAPYAEDRSRVAVLGPDGRYRAHAGEEGDRVDFVRLDPDERAGVFSISALSIAGAEVADPAFAIRLANGLPRAIREGVMLVATDDDPWVEFPVDEASAAAPGAVVVAFRVEARGLPELLWSMVGDEASATHRLQSVEARLEALGAKHSTLEQVASAQGSRLASVGHVVDEIAGWTRRRSLGDEASALHRLQSVEARLEALGAKHSTLEQVASAQGSRLASVGHVVDEIAGWTRRRSLGDEASALHRLQSVEARLEALHRLQSVEARLEALGAKLSTLEQVASAQGSHLASVGRVVDEIAGWIRRRSLRYWWWRWRGSNPSGGGSA